MTVLAGFPDAELLVMDILAPIGTTVTATAETVTPPVIQVQRVGGADNGITDQPRVQVVCYGANRPAAWTLAEQARQRILAAGGTSVGGVFVDSTRTETPTVQRPDPNPDLRAVTAVYRLTYRR